MATANWYYYNKNGEKIGPISVASLKALTGQGLITRETVLVNHTGRTLAAGEVNGLTFPEAARPESAIPPMPSELSGKEDVLVLPPPTDGDVYGLSSPEPQVTPPAKPFVPRYAVPPDKPNPFTTTPPTESNPFTAATPQSVSQSVSVPVADNRKKPSMPVIFAGIASVLFLFLLIGGIWKMSSSPVKFTAEEQAEIDSFCEAFGNDVRAVDEHGNTSFHRVAFKGSIPVAKYLFSKGVDVNAKDKSDFTPLHAAVLGNANTDFIKYLVSQGADIHAKGLYGETPLHNAASEHDIELTKFLISKGADVNMKSESGYTPLHRAAQNLKKAKNSPVEIVEFLVSQGADATARTKDGHTPLHNAAHNAEIARFLVSKGADVNAKTENGYTPLHSAVYSKDTEAIEFLVSQGANTNAKNKHGKTPLDLAKEMENVNTEIVDYLTSLSNAMPTPTPSHSNTKSSADDPAEMSIDKFTELFGSDVKATDEDGLTLLHKASAIGNIDVVKHLVSKGAEVNAKGKEDFTPLHMAMGKNVEIAKYLVSRGADINHFQRSQCEYQG